MINTVIFDFDGLLVDSEMVYYKMYQRLIGPYGGYFSIEEYGNTYCGKKLNDNLTAMVEKFKLPMSPKEAQNFIETIELEYIEQGIPLKKGARELLDYLKENGYKIVLATSSLAVRAEKILKSNNALEYFDEMAFGFEVKNGKPAPDIFLLACQKADSAIEQSLVLEDSDAGIKAGYDAKIETVCIPDIKKPSEETVRIADHIFESLFDVIDYLKKDRGE